MKRLQRWQEKLEGMVEAYGTKTVGERMGVSRQKLHHWIHGGGISLPMMFRMMDTFPSVFVASDFRDIDDYSDVF